LFFVEIQLS